MADYIYAVARIRKKETTLLSQGFFDRLLSAEDEESAKKLLREHGYEGEEKEDAKTWSLMAELVPDLSVFDVFLYENDFHNLKAAVKEAYVKQEIPGVYIPHGSVPLDLIRDAVKKRAFRYLPEMLAGPAEEASDTLLKTRDGQLCDMIIDRAALSAIQEAAKSSGSDLMKLYGELTTVIADLRIAARGQAMGKDPAFLRKYMAPAETIDVDSLAKAAGKKEGGLSDYLKKTPYGGGAGELAKSMADFERWCDDLLMDRIRPELHHSFGIDPLAAYILGKRNEIKTVRIILTGKHNGLSEEAIRRRVRKSYLR